MKLTAKRLRDISRRSRTAIQDIPDLVAEIKRLNKLLNFERGYRRKLRDDYLTLKLRVKLKVKEEKE